MSVWSEISKLAKRLLGSDAPTPVDLSHIDRELSPVRTPTLERPSYPKSPSCHETEHIEVLPEYKFVLEAIGKGCPGIFVTGRAGTGKSTLIRYLSEKVKNCAVVAPTGLAAINVHGSTIHSFFSIPPRTLNPDEAFTPRRQMIPVIECLGALIIDEVSMVTPDLVDCISNSLQQARGDPRPFGGIPVVFVGDLLQLPPVVRDPEVARYYTDRYRTPYFFSADVFKNEKMLRIQLTKVFRQTDLEFIELLDRIRLNSDHRDAVARINRECYRDREPNPEPSLFLVPTNAAARGINSQNLNVLDSPIMEFDAIVEGNFDVQRDRFQAPHRLQLKVGAQVIFVKNNKPYWLNGTLGRVTSIDEVYLRVELAKSGNTVTVERATWEKIQYEYDPTEKRIVSKVVGTFKQFPVTLGWAITIHKSQGMTLDSVRIDLGRGAFCSGQTYVALSRCRTIDGISLDRPISMNDVMADTTILEFYRRLQEMSNQEEKTDQTPDNDGAIA